MESLESEASQVGNFRRDEPFMQWFRARCPLNAANMDGADTQLWTADDEQFVWWLYEAWCAALEMK